MLQIYNTLTRQKEEFKPIVPGKASLYACGVTVYDYCHLGHARSLITFDMIHRTLRHKGYDVTFVRNFTDIDDKIINRANERGVDYTVITQQFIQAFNEDVTALGLVPPAMEPKATEHIAEMIEIIKGLEAKGLAYAVNGDVFFAVRAFKEYGKLSGKNIEELESGARVDVLEAKKDPLDFALWKAAKPGEPKWPSPWGDGRPGWHIECSAMSMKYLGQTFDIHGGGRDLIFPHHENELAQSEGCTGKVFANYWIHNGFVNINAEKMSKSLNNFLTIRDLLKLYPAEALRLFILSAHYRSPLDYTEENLTQACAGLERFYETRRRIEKFDGTVAMERADPSIREAVGRLEAEFEAAMDDDFNTAKVVGAIFESVREWNKILDEKRPVSSECLKKYLKALDKIHGVLGLFGSNSEKILNELRQKGVEAKGVSPEEIEKLIVERREARAKKDFKRSDAIRDELKSRGVILKDNPDGTTGWTVG